MGKGVQTSPTRHGPKHWGELACRRGDEEQAGFNAVQLTLPAVRCCGELRQEGHACHLCPLALT